MTYPVMVLQPQRAGGIDTTPNAMDGAASLSIGQLQYYGFAICQIVLRPLLL